MTRRSQPTDAELIRYLEGEVTQSRAGQIVVLAQSNAAERKRLEAMERMLELVAQPDERSGEIDLVAAVHEQIARGEPPIAERRPRRTLLALCAIFAAVVLVPLPLVLDDEQPAAIEAPAPITPAQTRMQHQPEVRKEEVERQILSWLSLDEKR